MFCRDITECLKVESGILEEVKKAEQKCFQVSVLCIYDQTDNINTYQNLNKLAELVRGELHKLIRKIIGALITLDVHSRDVVTQMVQNNVSSIK